MGFANRLSSQKKTAFSLDLTVHSSDRREKIGLVSFWRQAQPRKLPDRSCERAALESIRRGDRTFTATWPAVREQWRSPDRRVRGRCLTARGIVLERLHWNDASIGGLASPETRALA